jgi:uncharacterized membrane protein YgaE (UPF0421/DUF939 family)
MVEVKPEILNEILTELKLIKKEIKNLKSKEEDLNEFVAYLEKENMLATKKDAKEVGLKI